MEYLTSFERLLVRVCTVVIEHYAEEEKARPLAALGAKAEESFRKLRQSRQPAYKPIIAWERRA